MAKPTLASGLRASLTNRTRMFQKRISLRGLCLTKVSMWQGEAWGDTKLPEDHSEIPADVAPSLIPERVWGVRSRAGLLKE